MLSISLTCLFCVLTGISVKIQGKGEVQWTEQRSHSSDSNNTTMQNVASSALQSVDPSSTDTYSSEESYFENKFSVLGGGNLFLFYIYFANQTRILLKILINFRN